MDDVDVMIGRCDCIQFVGMVDARRIRERLSVKAGDSSVRNNCRAMKDLHSSQLFPLKNRVLTLDDRGSWTAPRIDVALAARQDGPLDDVCTSRGCALPILLDVAGIA